MFMKLYRRYLQNDAWQVCYMDSSLRDSHTFPNSIVNEYPYFVISGTGDLQALPLRTCDFHFYDSICFQEGIGLHSNQGWWLYCHFSASGNNLPSFFTHDQQQISCFVYVSKIVNYHNAVAEHIPLIWQKIERNVT